MKKIFTLFFLSFILFSCSRDNEDEIIENNEPLVTKMSSLVLYSGFTFNTNMDLNVYFQYDNDKRLTRKTGGFLPVSGSTGFGGFFSDKVFTTLVYSGNTVLVENFSSSPDFTVPKNSKYFVLNNNNQIIQKEFEDGHEYLYKKQQFKYSNGQLIEILTTLPKMPFYPPNDFIETYLEKFYYDSNGNLTKSEYIFQKDGVNTNEKTVRTFEDYDNSYNPWKRLYLLDEFFYRSISKNNFRKFNEIQYNEVGNITSSTEQSWSFNYDSSGSIIIN